MRITLRQRLVVGSSLRGYLRPFPAEKHTGFTFSEMEGRSFPLARIAAEHMLYNTPALHLCEVHENREGRESLPK